MLWCGAVREGAYIGCGTWMIYSWAHKFDTVSDWFQLIWGGITSGDSLLGWNLLREFEEGTI